MTARPGDPSTAQILQSPSALEDLPILLVDDERDVLKALERTVRRGKWSVVSALGPEEGLAQLAAREFGVIISDFRMPGMDGSAFLARAREMWPQSERILLTAHADLDALERGINDASIGRFMRKPWDGNVLIDIIGRALEQSRLRRENVVLLSRLRDATFQQRMSHMDKMAAIGRLASGVAHEINNPLHGILSFVQLAQRPDVAPDKLVRYHAVIRDCALRCRDIVDGLRNYSRQAKPEERALIDFNGVCEKAMVMFETVEDKHLSYRPATQAATCSANANQLQQVVINLIQNALDAAPKGGHVQLQVQVDNDQVVLTVDDDGPGVPAEIREKIFEPFFTTKPEGVGTGLGLSICHNLVTEHQGSLHVGASPQQGARFELHLPRSTRNSSKESRS